jgi:phosphatidylglycerol lysyltransferase
VRTAINRATRERLTAQWFTWSEAPLALREQIARLSEEWLAAKGLPEMGFTLGGLDELTDDAVRCLAAVGPRGELHALTSWLPARREGVPVGWTLDVMRRAGHASPGVMEFLIATAILAFQDEGAEWVSLSGAPLALPQGAADSGRLNRLLALAGRTMEPVYGFRSLLAFKGKFQPQYRPLWLVYPSAADLPRIARAVSGAYLPHVSVGEAARLARALLLGHRTNAPTAQLSAGPVSRLP